MTNLYKMNNSFGLLYSPPHILRLWKLQEKSSQWQNLPLYFSDVCRRRAWHWHTPQIHSPRPEHGTLLVELGLKKWQTYIYCAFHLRLVTRFLVISSWNSHDTIYMFTINLINVMNKLDTFLAINKALSYPKSDNHALCHYSLQLTHYSRDTDLPVFCTVAKRLEPRSGPT